LSEFIEVDGSIGEGGGQILRTSLSFSVITGRPIRIVKIRAGRKEPGLRPQHLQAAISVSRLCNGKLRGAEVGSTTLEFIPGKIPEKFEQVIDTGTAGSITLIAQTLIPISIFGGVAIDVEVVGGTEVPNSPTIDYLTRIVQPVYRKLGAELDIKVVRRGYYPRGGGRVKISCGPIYSSPRSLDLFAFASGRKEEVEVPKLSILSVSRSLPDHVTRRQMEAAKSVLDRAGFGDLSGNEMDSAGPSFSPGSSVLVYANGESTLIGASSLGERGKRAELVGEEASRKFIEEWACKPNADSHLADMLATLLPCLNQSRERGMSFTTSGITQHLRTNIEVASKFFPECNFEINPPESEGNVSHCWQITYSAKAEKSN
jgi:RNA 3'-terminal phosphate cyclase (ATP)